MFAYNPTVNDNSGMIRGQGITNSAQIMGQAKVGLVKDIGGALLGLAGGLADNYMKKTEMESAVKSGDKMLNMFGDQLGIDENTLKQFNYGDMNLDDKYAFHKTLWGNLGALSQLRMADQRVGVQQTGQALTAAMPGIREGAENNAAVAGGLRTYSPPPLQNVVPPPSPSGSGFGNINQGMPGSAMMPPQPIGTRPMAVRPGR